VKWPIRGTGAVLLVPPSAVVSTSERTFVIRMNGEVAEWIDVKKGATQGDLIEIVGPLKEGDTILRRGSDEIREGTRLKVHLAATSKG
jgi:membrane fusion protein, multidrug efflux system